MKSMCAANCEVEITCCCCNVQFTCMCSLHQHFVRDKNTLKYLIDLVSCTAKFIEHCEVKKKTEAVGVARLNEEQSHYVKHDELSTRIGGKKLQFTDSPSLSDDSTEGPEHLKSSILRVSAGIADKIDCISSELISKSEQQIEQTETSLAAAAADDDDDDDDASDSDVIDKDIVLSHNDKVNGLIHTVNLEQRTQQEDEAVINKTKVPCDVCGHMYKKRNLKQHKKMHTDTKEFTCEVCQKVFRTASCLYGHQQHHTTEKDQICDYCGKQFNNWPNLRQHIKTHTRERTLQCPLCSKKFSSNYVLRDHISRHSGEKPFSCTDCSRSFKKSQELKRHMMTYHSETREHVCKICQKKFKSKSNRVKHEKTHDRKRKS